MLDVVGVFTFEVLGHRVDHRLGRSLPAMNASLTNPNSSVFAVNANQQPAIPKYSFDSFDLGWCWHIGVIRLLRMWLASAEALKLKSFASREGSS